MSFFRRLFGSDKTTSAANDYIEPDLGLVFPLQLGGLQRKSEGRPYAEGDRSGHSIAYGLADLQATIYVTKVSRSDFPDGGESDFIAEELESAMAAVQQMERVGYYQGVKMYSAPPVRLGKGPDNLVWARGAFFAMNQGKPMVSFIHLTALRGRVIKLRISPLIPRTS
jgi:hypothetical protein